MNKPQLTRRAAIAAATVAAIAAGGSAAALATESSTANVYQGCLRHGLGALYHVSLNPSSPPDCLPHDTLVNWNQTGPAGAAGAAGPQGPKGDVGAAGPQGAKGDSGAAGTAGSDGKTVLNGTGAPGPALGANGDFYIDTAASAIYGPKTDSGWGNPASLKGAQGAAGASGPKGDPGPSGPKGDTGPTGPMGPQGPQGLPGVGGLYWLTTSHTLPAGGSTAYDVKCNVGDNVYGGGAWVQSSNGEQSTTENAPSGDLNGWYAEVWNSDIVNTYTVHFYALCGPSGLTISNR